MSGFDPESLSPLPIEPRVCDLPYGLVWDDLRPCLPDWDERAVDGPRAFVSHEKQGLHGGHSCILTFRFATVDGALGETTVFVKQSTHGGRAEAAKYRVLAAKGVPTPRLLTAITRAAGEVLVLEFLPRIGIEFSSLSEVGELLHLVARLNAVETTADLFEPGRGVPRSEFDVRVRAALTRLAPNPFADTGRLLRAYEAARDAAASMPRALCHGELYFQQVGWSERDDARTLVMFDLATMSRQPRFADIASLLARLAVESGRPELEFFVVYLQSLRRLAGVEVPIAEAFRELRLVRVVRVCESLPWLMRVVDEAEGFDRRSELALAMRSLHDDLMGLELLEAR